jgi:hypothetical protein
LSFVFDVTTSYHTGDTITARWVGGPSSDLPTGRIRTAVAASDTGTVRDTTLFVLGGFTETTTGRAASLQLRWQHWPIPGTVWNHPPHYEGVLSPYVDALVTTDTSKTGYLNIGMQYAGFLSDLGVPLEQVALYVTPRSESDQKVTVSNFMYFDGEVRPLFHGLFGAIPVADGSYEIVPHGGVELGRTVVGTRVARAESDNPSRWKAGVGATLKFPAAKGTAWYCQFFGCAGVDLSGDWQHYWLNHAGARAKSASWNWSTITAQYRFTRHLGLAASLHNGNPPPLFSYQRLVQIGLSFVN